MAIYFISDLHLGHDPRVNAGFRQWLSGLNSSSVDALYILGDFFDAWIGDDDDAPMVNETCDLLNDFSATTPTFVMRGNRDFLLGQTFAERSGTELIGDQHCIDLFGQPALLMHGDSLCTRDTEYMQFRAMVRSPQWQQQVLSLPLEQRRAMAADLRAKSQSFNAMKAEDITDVTPEDVINVMAEHKVNTLIHGHTHRPAVHDVIVDGNAAKRYVLGAWHDSGWYIKADLSGLELVQFELPESIS